MDLLPGLPPGCGPPPPAPTAHVPAPGHRRCNSAPSLDAMADAALRLDVTPCSVLDAQPLDDDVSRSLRRTLQDAQRELLAMMEAGALQPAAPGSGGPGPSGAAGARRLEGGGGALEWGDAGSEGDGPHSQQAGAHSGGSGDRGAGGTAAAAAADLEAELGLDLAGLSAREREAALKRAKNREAARRSRERKAERISGLQAEVARLRANNFVLARCVEEVALKALQARGEQRQLRDKLARLQADPHAASAAGGSLPAGIAATAGAQPLAPPPSPAGRQAVAAAEACTPPAAQRAAALEAELLALDMAAAAPASPTRLLFPAWPQQQQAAAPAAAPAPAAALPAELAPGPPCEQLKQHPTSAELRRELRRAVAGDSSGSSSGAASAEGAPGRAAWGAAGGAGGHAAGPAHAATHHHLLHPSPVLGSRSHQQRDQQLPDELQLLGTFLDLPSTLPPALLSLRQEGGEFLGPAGGLPRTWSAPVSLEAAPRPASAPAGAGGKEGGEAAALAAEAAGRLPLRLVAL